MPTVLNSAGYRLLIYTRDHAPMHVHVWCRGNKAIIEFETTVGVRGNPGLNRRELRQAVVLVRKHREYLIERWREIYG